MEKKDVNKVMNHFRTLMRSGCSLKKSIQDEESIWLVDGYVAVKVPKAMMELNPERFEDFDISAAIPNTDGLAPLKATHLIEHDPRSNFTTVPFKGDGFVFWCQKKYFDIFPERSVLFSLNGTSAAAVWHDGEIIGIICPVRKETDISLFV